MEKTYHAALAGLGGGGYTSRRQAKSDENSSRHPPLRRTDRLGLVSGTLGPQHHPTQPGHRGFETPLPSLPKCTRLGAGAPSPLPLRTRNRKWPVGGTRAMASGRSQVREEGNEAATRSSWTAGLIACSSPEPAAKGAGAPHSRTAAGLAAPPPRAPSPPRRVVAPPSSLAPPLPQGVAARGRQTALHSFQKLQRQQ